MEIDVGTPRPMSRPRHRIGRFLSALDLERAYSEMAKAKLSPRTIRYVRTAISS
jgi:hypothetical protein